jgi:hypothetical protein
MSTEERQGVRLGLSIIALASVVLAIMGWSLWPLGGLIVPALGLWLLRPRTGEAPRQNRGASHPKG